MPTQHEQSIALEGTVYIQFSIDCGTDYGAVHTV